jgi:hypothetical protein
LGRQIEAEIYAGYPERFCENVLSAWREKGVPRNRSLHSCLGLSEDNLFILQREGTIEEVAHWLWEVGAKDGLILDNGASPFCWAWWLYPKGGFLFTAPDYRSNASAVIAFILKGPAATDLPGGSMSFSVVLGSDGERNRRYTCRRKGRGDCMLIDKKSRSEFLQSEVDGPQVQGPWAELRTALVCLTYALIVLKRVSR